MVQSVSPRGRGKIRPTGQADCSARDFPECDAGHEQHPWFCGLPQVCAGKLGGKSAL